MNFLLNFILLPFIYFVSMYSLGEVFPSIFTVLFVFAMNLFFLWVWGKIQNAHNAKSILLIILAGSASLYIPSDRIHIVWLLLTSCLYAALLYKSGRAGGGQLEYSWIKLMLFALAFSLLSFSYYFSMKTLLWLAFFGFSYFIFYGGLEHLTGALKRKHFIAFVLALMATQIFIAITFLPAIPVIGALITAATAASLFQIVHYYLLHELSLQRLTYELIINAIFIFLGSLAGRWTF